MIMRHEHFTDLKAEEPRKVFHFHITVIPRFETLPTESINFDPEDAVILSLE